MKQQKLTPKKGLKRIITPTYEISVDIIVSDLEV